MHCSAWAVCVLFAVSSYDLNHTEMPLKSPLSKRERAFFLVLIFRDQLCKTRGLSSEQFPDLEEFAAQLAQRDMNRRIFRKFDTRNGF
jgi:hypothetical protein